MPLLRGKIYDYGALMLEHKHLLAMGDMRYPPTSTELLEGWMEKLVADLKMKILIRPKAVYCDSVGNKGMTCICAIETSHIVMHTWDASIPIRMAHVNGAKMQLDVYTCSNLDLSIVWDSLREFGIRGVRYKFYDRNTDFHLLGQGK